ncbi:Fibroblast growth factor receptor-like 1, partial [Characodon lateralis]|nr:Fibroblast growth factor receptor-like 1 [Characodon lateralis]
DSSLRNGAGEPTGDSVHPPDLAGKLVRPRFTEPAKMRRRVIERPVGSSVRLKCTASGNPHPDIIWLKDSKPLADEEGGAGGERKKKRWTLSLRNLTPEHSGKYTCHVSNKAGEINATYKVEVIRKFDREAGATPSQTIHASSPLKVTLLGSGSIHPVPSCVKEQIPVLLMG